MQILKPITKPIAAADFTPRWLHDQRATVIRDGHELRPGFPLSIEIAGPRGWYRLMLPNNGYEFLSAEDRDTVLGQLTGDIELPEEPS